MIEFVLPILNVFGHIVAWAMIIAGGGLLYDTVYRLDAHRHHKSSNIAVAIFVVGLYAFAILWIMAH